MLSQPHPRQSRKRRNPQATLAIAAFAAFLATFNETYLNVGFAPLMQALAVDVGTVQWLATAYMLGAAIMVPVSAFAYRTFPTRPLFCATSALLVTGSIIGALAPTFPVLLCGRIVQALGTGMLIPIGMNITLEVAPREKLGTYMGIMGAMTTLGPSVSVIAAGLILAVAPWPVLLWVFAGLSLLCLLAGALILGDIAHLTHPRLDAASVALISMALVGILYGVSTLFVGSLPVAVAAIVVGAVVLALFLRRQKRLAEPLIDLRPLAIKPFAVGVVVNMVSLITIFAMNIIVPTFLQSVLATPPLIASLALFPAILCSCAASPLAGRLFDRRGPGTLLPLGFVCIGVFSVLMAALLPTAPIAVLAVVYIPVICGSALIIGPVQSFALSKLSPELNPHGVTVMSTGFQIAGCLGSSVFTGIYALVGAMAQKDGTQTTQAAADGMLAVGVLVAICALAGLGLSLWIRKNASAAPAPTPAWEGSRQTADQGAQATSSVASLMKTEVYTLAPDQRVADALRLFAERGISGAPVVDAQGRPVGFLSNGDVMAALADQVPAFKSAWSFVVQQGNADFERTVREVLSQPVSSLATGHVVTVDVNDDLGAVAKTLTDRRLKKVPVLSQGRMVGIVTRSNIAHYAVRHYLPGATEGRL